MFGIDELKEKVSELESRLALQEQNLEYLRKLLVEAGVITPGPLTSYLAYFDTRTCAGIDVAGLRDALDQLLEYLELELVEVPAKEKRMSLREREENG